MDRAREARDGQDSAVDRPQCMESRGRRTYIVISPVHGPRVSEDRPAKGAEAGLESYWDGRSTRAELDGAGAGLRERTWRRLAELGLAGLPSNTFSLYDQVLDTAVLLGAVPRRYVEAEDPYFAMARGADGMAPLRMTKWFDTNYHYIVPEIGAETVFAARRRQAARRAAAGSGAGLRDAARVVGPVTFLLLCRRAEAGRIVPLERLEEVLGCYEELLAPSRPRAWTGCSSTSPRWWPTGLPRSWPPSRTAYERLGSAASRPGLFVASYFGDLGEALPVLAATPVEAIGVDLVRGGLDRLPALAGKTVVAGVVSGRDVWRTDSGAGAAPAARGAGARGGRGGQHLVLAPARAVRRCGGRRARPGAAGAAGLRRAEGGRGGRAGRAGRLPRRRAPPAARGGAGGPGRLVRGAPVRTRSAPRRRPRTCGCRALPITTIGSFPQTGELRAARAALVAGELDEARVRAAGRAEIERVIRLQERLGLDVLVHGEPERNDMVQYFAEHLDGFAVTAHGWVQSYGSRCTRPPILHGDVAAAGADHRAVGPLRAVADGQAGQGHAHRAGHDRRLVVRP